MKKQIVTLFLFILASGGIQAQKTVIKSYLEKLHSGYKVGSAIGRETYWQIEYGAFYQKATGNQNKESLYIGAVGEFENEFIGTYVAIPIQYSSEVVFKLQVRTGIINQETFVTTPSLLAHYIPADQLRFGFGIGFRALVPTIQTSFSFSF